MVSVKKVKQKYILSNYVILCIQLKVALCSKITAYSCSWTITKQFMSNIILISHYVKIML